MPKISSNTIHARIFPALSLLLISKSPHGFVVVISLARKFFCHSKRQTVGSSAYFPGSQPPPTPSPYASTQPRNSGSPMTNSFALVGSCAYSFNSVLQSWNACFAAGIFFHWTIHGFSWTIFLIGVIKKIPVGTSVSACRIFPISFSICLNGSPLFMRTILCRSANCN